MTNQHKKILEKLAKGKEVDNSTLNKICFRYGARIYDLRKLGYKIETIQKGLGYFSYKLVGVPKK